MPDGHPLLPGDPAELGGNRLLRRLGEGSQGVVYLGRDPSGEHVAIKLLHARMAEDRGARERFMRELAAAKKVARFCTAQVLDADVAGDHPYIVSEYVEGRSLRSQITADGPRTGGALERLAIGTLTALAAIHKAGIVHRDFTPHNVLVGPDGPRVIDFGIARALGAARLEDSNTVGTPAYMSPEQVSSRAVGPPADMFSWGSTIVFAATGHPPFGNESVHAVMERIVDAEPDVSALPEPLRSVVTACLSKDPAQRPTAQQAQASLLGHEATEALMPPPAFGAPPAGSVSPDGAGDPAVAASAAVGRSGEGGTEQPSPEPHGQSWAVPAPAESAPPTQTVASRAAPPTSGPDTGPDPHDRRWATPAPAESGPSNDATVRPAAAGVVPHGIRPPAAPGPTGALAAGGAAGQHDPTGRPWAVAAEGGPSVRAVTGPAGTATRPPASAPPAGLSPGAQDQATRDRPAHAPAGRDGVVHAPAGSGPSGPASGPGTTGSGPSRSASGPGTTGSGPSGSASGPGTAGSGPSGSVGHGSSAEAPLADRAATGAAGRRAARSERSPSGSVLTPAATATARPAGRRRLGWALLAGAAVIVIGAVVAVPLWPDGGDAARAAPQAQAATAPATPPASTPSPSPSVSHGPQLNGIRSGAVKPPKKHAKTPAKGCRDYQRAYAVSGAGSALLKTSVCRGAYTGSVVLGDTSAKDGWDVCLQLRGHVKGTAAEYISTILTSRNGGVQSFDNGPKTRYGAKTTRTEDQVTVNVGRCKGSGAGIQTSWQSQDQLASG